MESETRVGPKDDLSTRRCDPIPMSNRLLMRIVVPRWSSTGPRLPIGPYPVLTLLLAVGILFGPVPLGSGMSGLRLNSLGWGDEVSSGEGVPQEMPTSAEFAMENLSPPPPELARLIESAGIQFRAGGRPPSREDAAAAGTGVETRGQFANRVDATTNYHIRYHYETHSQWRLEDRGARRRLVITIRFRNVRWNPSHVIWFRQPPPAKDFWSQPIVRHEFDHARLSGDPRWGKDFAARLDERRVLTIPITGDDRIDEDAIGQRVDAHVEEIFQEIAELIEIRYRELDRLTNHGMEPLPEGSEISQILQSHPSLGR